MSVTVAFMVTHIRNRLVHFSLSRPIATQCHHKNYSIIIVDGHKSGSGIEEDIRFKTHTIWAHKLDVSIKSWLKKQTHKLKWSSFKKARSWELQEIKLTITVILLKMNFCLFPTFQVTSEDSFQFSLHINDNELGALRDPYPKRIKCILMLPKSCVNDFRCNSGMASNLLLNRCKSFHMKNPSELIAV